MTGTKQIPILHVCSTNKNKSKEFPADEISLEVYFMDTGELESVIVDESSMEENK